MYIYVPTYPEMRKGLAAFSFSPSFPEMTSQPKARAAMKKRRANLARLDLYLLPEVDTRLRALAGELSLRPGTLAGLLLTDAVNKGRKPSKSNP